MRTPSFLLRLQCKGNESDPPPAEPRRRRPAPRCRRARELRRPARAAGPGGTVTSPVLGLAFGKAHGEPVSPRAPDGPNLCNRAARANSQSPASYRRRAGHRGDRASRETSSQRAQSSRESRPRDRKWRPPRKCLVVPAGRRARGATLPRGVGPGLAMDGKGGRATGSAEGTPQTLDLRS